jgi:hypothetical protein
MMVMVVHTAPLPAVGRPHVTSSMFFPEAVHHKALGYCDVLGNEYATATAAEAVAWRRRDGVHEGGIVRVHCKCACAWCDKDQFRVSVHSLAPPPSSDEGK